MNDIKQKDTTANFFKFIGTRKTRTINAVAHKISAVLIYCMEIIVEEFSEQKNFVVDFNRCNNNELKAVISLKESTTLKVKITCNTTRLLEYEYQTIPEITKWINQMVDFVTICGDPDMMGKDISKIISEDLNLEESQVLVVIAPRELKQGDAFCIQIKY